MADPSQEIRKLAKELDGIPKELRKRLRPALKVAAEPIVADAKGRASWSTRIPRAISLSVRFSQRDPGVSIRVRSKVAPHGRPYEGITGNAAFRHPVFGHRDRWVSQETRSYLVPAAEAGMDGALAATVEVVDQVAREQGFR
ncbi:HK97 gp10 family phage protein (plasmid) [Nonomuraea sp. CA-143628]|uniref:HK97 gp10 family phage protein n=1 Tax=Nonomuraea sp. CA-143628 TaxID=3239997 RepID=UPI003D8B8D35